MVDFGFLIYILFDIWVQNVPAKIEHNPLTIIRCAAVPGLCGNSQHTTFYLP